MNNKTENAILNTDNLLINIKGDVVIDGTLTLDYGANSLIFRKPNQF